MALASKSVPNLINGVTQQPPELRLNNQLEVQENGYPDVVEGLRKRPPSLFLKYLLKCSSSWTAGASTSDLTTSNTERLTSSELANALIHTYKRDSEETYTVLVIPQESGGVVQDPLLLIYDEEGNLRYQAGKSSWLPDGSSITYTINTVTYYGNSDSTAYLKDATPDTTIKATSVADATFLVNTKTIIRLSDDKIPAKSGNSALIHLKSVNYSKDYDITLESKSSNERFTASADTADPSSNTHYNELKVSTIATDLRAQVISIGAQAGDTTYFNAQNAIINKDGDTFLRDDELAPYLTLTKTNGYEEDGVAATGTFPALGALTVLVGSNGLSYSSAEQADWDNNDYLPREGWVYADGADPTPDAIVLPRNVVTTYQSGNWSSGYEIILTVPPVSCIEQDPSNAKFVVTPAIDRNEGYFVITSTPEGSFGDFDVFVADDNGGRDLVGIKDIAKSFADLPNQCVAGYRLAVTGDGSRGEDDFYVVFTGAGGSGVWRESVAGGIQNDYDNATMPHQLRQDPLVTGSLRFSFESIVYDSRLVGDESTNPPPSFVDNTINDVFFYRNRLAFLSDDNVIFSENGEYFNFYRTTVRSLLDSDPIDISISNAEVSTLKAATAIQDYLLLFSEQNQFTLSSAQLLTPTDVKADLSTQYECDLTARPVIAGNSVFFATANQYYSGVREYVTNPNTEINEAPLVTNHVPEYIQGTITKMVSSTNKNMLLCLNSVDKKVVYVYKWYDSDSQRLQSAWSKWIFDKDVLNIAFNNSRMYITFGDGSFEELDLASNEQSINFTNVKNLVKNDTGFTLTSPLYTKQDFLQFTYGNQTYLTSVLLKFQTFGSSPSIEFTATTALKALNLASITFNSEVYAFADASSVDYADGSTKYTWTPSGAQAAAVQSIVDGTTLPDGTSTTVWYLTLNVDVTQEYSGKAYDVYLDHRRKLNSANSASFSLSDIPSSDLTATTKFVDHLGVVIATGTSSAELDKVVAYINGQTHTENGVVVYNYLYSGEPYTFTATLSEPVFDYGKKDASKLARMQIRSFNVSFSDTAFFNFKVKAKDRDEVVATYTAKQFGDSGNILGFLPNIEYGDKKFSVLSNATNVKLTLENDSHLPSTFQSGEYEVMFHYRNPVRL
jgi:hypothetical protein